MSCDDCEDAYKKANKPTPCDACKMPDELRRPDRQRNPVDDRVRKILGAYQLLRSDLTGKYPDLILQRAFGDNISMATASLYLDGLVVCQSVMERQNGNN